MRFKRKARVTTVYAAEPLDGWHEGWLTSIQIQRRQGRHEGAQYYPSGWDLVDMQSQEIIAEFNDETAPPTDEFMTGMRAGLAPQDGNELGEMFKEIYNLCYDTTIKAMQLMGRAMPEHKDSNDGQPIAQIVIGAYTRLPETITMTKKEAMAAEQPF